MRRQLAAAGLVLVLAGAGAAVVAAAGPPAPPNDNRAGAQVLASLPAAANGTTVGATVEMTGEPTSTCASAPTGGSVWYSLLAGNASRIAVNLAANGKLDGVVEVYLAERSQLTAVACDPTDTDGKAAVTFTPTKGATYLIRVAQLADSLPATFALDVFRPQPAATPPGSPLPAGGADGAVDRVQNVSQAFSVGLSPGVSYRINLANETTGACVTLELYPPGTSSFDAAEPVLRIGCGGYRVFTPGPGAGGRYVLLVTPSQSFRAVQSFHLQIAPAGPENIAPGTFLANYARAGGRLDADGIDVERLFRFDVVKRSDLTLKLDAAPAAAFDVELRNDQGHEIACACGAQGPQTLQQQLRPGRYFAAVIARAGAGKFTLTRESRTITHTTIGIAGGAHTQSPPGVAVPISVRVAPGASGPLTVTVERFDPVFRWQFLRTITLRASSGRAVASFLPPAVGRFRVSAAFAGTRTASPSNSGFANLLVAGPLRQ